MSTPDHARANFRMLLCAAADGNLASESANDTDLLAQRVADLELARSHVSLPRHADKARGPRAVPHAPDIHAACCAVVEQIDLSEERGAAVFRAALAAIREAERRRTASL